MAGLVNYHCESCKRSRKTVILPDIHNINLSASANGLVTYTDIHKCANEILGASNIHIDAHYNVRGVEYMKLPRSAILLKEEPKPLIPIPSSNKTGTMIILTDIIPDKQIQMIYRNKGFNYQIRIGSLKKDAKPIETLQSKGRQSTIEYFESEIQLSANLRSWFELLMDTIEENPPIKLGLILEALVFVFEHPEKEIHKVDHKLMRDLFCSHLINVELIQSDIAEAIEKVKNQLDDELISQLKTLIGDLDLNPGQRLFSLSGLSKDMIQLVLNLYLLEKLGVVKLNFNNVNDVDVDLEIRKNLLN